VQEDAQGRVLFATRVQSAKALDDLFAPSALKQTLGAQLALDKNKTSRNTASIKGAELRLWAPTARTVSVCVYPDAQISRNSAHTAPTRCHFWRLAHAGEACQARYLLQICG